MIRPSALGDVCRSVPVLACLRAAYPEAFIAWVVQDDFAPAIEAHPALNEVIAFPRRRFAHWWASPSRAWEVRQWLRGLRERRFDTVIDCQGLSRSGLIARATRAPVRIGPRSARECAWLFYNRRVPTDGSPMPTHTVDQMLALLQPLGVPAAGDMRLYVGGEHQRWWNQERRTRGFDDSSPYAVIAPGSRWLSKRWPIERFAELVEPLLQRGLSRVVVIGSAGEREQVQPLLQRFGIAGGDRQPPLTHPVVDLVGRTSIGQTMAVIESAGLVIANDSAPLHMAVGFDRPCVALFGPTDPAAVGPYRRAECVVRAYQPTAGREPSFKDARLGDSLMRLISVAMVLQTADRVRSLWPSRGQAAPIVSRSVVSPRVADDPPDVHVARGMEPEAAS